MPTIRDVAKAAGVSVSTVSNILNNKISVSEELYQRVMKAMQDLQYHPNMLAMNLRKNKISFIGIIASSLSGHCHQIFEGIYRGLDARKCQPILKLVNDAAEEMEAIEVLQSMSISGAIVISSNLNEELIAKYQSVSFPLVFVDFYPINSEFNVVRFDNYAIIREVTDEILRNRNRTALITCSRLLGSEDDCVRGFLDACAEHSIQDPVIYESVFNKEQAFAGLLDFISEESNLDSVIVSNDQIAKTVTEILGLLGKKDIVVYSLSGDSWYRHRTDSVVYIKRGAIFCGSEAARLLFENMDQPITFDTRQITLPHHTDAQEVFEDAMPAVLSEEDAGTIRLLLLRSNMSRAIEKLSGDFTARTGIRLSIQTASQHDISRILQSDAMERQEYDVVMADMHWLPFLTKRNALCPLNGLLDLERILPKYIHDVRNYILSEADEEIVQALPIMAGHQILAYRRDLFEDALLKKKFYLKYGVQLIPPRSWNEFNLVAKFFTRSENEESPIRYGTCLLGNAPEGIMAEYLPRQWAYNGRFFKNGVPDLENVANLKAIRNLAEAYRYSVPDCREYLEEEQIRDFLGGEIAMIMTYNVHLQDLAEAKDRRIGYIQPPGSASLIGGWMIGINAHSKHIEESAKFLTWELSDRISAHSSLLGQVSPFKNVFFDNELLTLYPWMNAINEERVTLRAKERDTFDSAGKDERTIEMVLSGYLWRAMCGEITPEEALREAQRRVCLEN